MSLYGILKRTYHKVLPERVRDAIYKATPRPLLNVRQKFIGTLEKGAAHDEIYDEDYYTRTVDPAMQMSTKTMAGTIVAHFKPTSVVDVGCGTGMLLLALKERGVKGVGLEYAVAGYEICKKRGLEVTRFDIEKDATPAIRADLVISTEVAEHLPESCADRFVDLLCGMGTRVFLTAAVPGVRGTDHVNEQPNEYWIAKFEARGLRYDQAESMRWRKEWQDAGVAGCFANTVMLFEKRTA